MTETNSNLSRLALSWPKAPYWWGTFPGEPQSKDRPRFGRAKYSNRINTFTSKKTRTAERSLALEAKQVWHQLTCKPPDSVHEFGVRLLFYCSPTPEGRKKFVKGAPGGPDGDNMEKLVLDTLTGLIWENDRQVRYCVWLCLPAEGMPRTEILFHHLAAQWWEGEKEEK